MKYLVTGGAGFIGSNIVEELVKRGESVRVLDNFSTGKRENLKGFEKDIEQIEGDIRDFNTVKKATEGVDFILHQAGQVFVQESIKNPFYNNEINVGGTLNLLQAAVDAGVKKFVFASSSAVYGDSPELPKREDMKPEPMSPYAVSKLAGEEYCRMYSKLHGFKTVSLRYFNVFGPRQDPNSEYSGVISKFIKKISNNERPVIYGDGKQTRDFVYVSDIADANIKAATTETNCTAVMNAACQKQTDLNYLTEQINKLTGKGIQPIYTEERNGDIKHSCGDKTLIEKMLGWKAVVSFETGLEKLITGSK